MSDIVVKAKVEGDVNDLLRAMDKATKAGDDFDKGMRDSAGGAEKGMKAGAAGIAAALGSVIAVIGAVVVAAGALFTVGGAVDSMKDSIIIATGESGAALDGLIGNAEAVALRVPSSFEDVGIAIGELNTRLGLTGKPLEDMAAGLLNLARITETDVETAMASSARVFGDWSIAAEDQAGALDKMFTITQQTGIGFDSLADKVVQFGAPLRNMGIGFDEAISIFGKWEKEGVNIETVMGGLRIGVANLAKSGEDVPTAFRAALESIQAMETGAEATSAAIEIFGSRAGPDMAAAIREGRFEIDDLVASLSTADGAIADSASRTADAAESWQIFKNAATVAIEPIASAVFELGSGALQWLADLMVDLAPTIKSMMDGVGPAFSSLGDTISKVLPPFLELWTQISPLSLAFKALQPVLPILMDALAEIGAVIGGALLTVMEALTPVVGVVVDLFLLLLDSLLPLIDPLLDIVMAFMPLITVVGELLAGLLPPFIDLLMALLEPIMALIGPLLELLTPALQLVADVIAVVVDWIAIVIGALVDWAVGTDDAGGAVTDIFEWIGEVVGGVIGFIADIIGWVVNDITTKFDQISKAVEIVGDVFRSVFEGIGDFVTGVFDGIVGGIKWAINQVISVINFAIDGLNGLSIDVPDWVPGIGGQTFGLDIPRMPMLADGGTAIAGGYAMVGEEGPEILYVPTGASVIPLDYDGVMPGSGGGSGASSDSAPVTYETNITVEGRDKRDEDLAAEIGAVVKFSVGV